MPAFHAPKQSDLTYHEITADIASLLNDGCGAPKPAPLGFFSTKKPKPTGRVCMSDTMKPSESGVGESMEFDINGLCPRCGSPLKGHTHFYAKNGGIAFCGYCGEAFHECSGKYRIGLPGPLCARNSHDFATEKENNCPICYRTPDESDIRLLPDTGKIICRECGCVFYHRYAKHKERHSKPRDPCCSKPVAQSDATSVECRGCGVGSCHTKEKSPGADPGFTCEVHVGVASCSCSSIPEICPVCLVATEEMSLTWVKGPTKWQSGGPLSLKSGVSVHKCPSCKIVVLDMNGVRMALV